LKEYLFYLIIRLLCFVFNQLPLRFALGCARVFGALIYLVNKKRRSIAYANLKAAFKAELSPRDRKRIVKGVYFNLAQSFIEVMRFPKIDKDYVERYVSIENRDILEEAVSRKKGVVLLAAHFGNWELLALSGAILGHPIHIIVKEQKLSRLNVLLNRYRELRGAHTVSKGISVKEIFKSLKENKLVGILADQDAGRNGVFVNFFGRLTSSPRGAFEIANKVGSVVLPVFMARQNGPYHKIFIENPIELEKGLDGESVSQKGLQIFTGLLEDYIKRYPSQWLWLHKRWKSCPDRTAVILDDGKIGHLNQSLAILKQLKRAHKDKFPHKGSFDAEIVRVEFKNKLCRFVFSVLARVLLPCIQGNLEFLKFAFKEDSFLKFSSIYADIIISCGSSTELLNLALKKENNAKSIIIMKPSVAPLKDFDLAVISSHDSPPRARPNVLEVLMSPNLIDEEYLNTNSAKLREKLKQDKPIKIGLLLGGDSKRAYFEESLVKSIIEQLKEASLKINASLLVTTSRRTKAAIEDLVEKELSGFANCGLLVIANKNNPDEAMGGILGLSSIIVTSSDSISMVSEAVSTAKPVVVFEAGRKSFSGRYKEKIIIDELSREGAIKLVKPSKLSDEIIGFSFRNFEISGHARSDKIYEYILGRMF
jgi:KDO2-lipid IV(A) lauroyltransferase